MLLPALVERTGVARWALGTREAQALYARFGFAPAPEGRFMLRGAPP